MILLDISLRKAGRKTAAADSLREEACRRPSLSPAIVRHRQSGFMLATVFMVIFLAMIAAFVFVNSSVFHMNAVQRADNDRQAQNMAESVIAKSLEKVMSDQTFGKSSSTTYNDVLSVVSESNGNAAAGLLAFNSSKASGALNPVTKSRINIPWSYNNLDSDGAKEGCGRTVPGYSIHLVGTGISNGVVKHVEAVIHVPPFPYAIASSGKFEAGSGLLLAAVRKAEDALGGVSSIDQKNLVPSHLASNSRDKKAVKLGANTKITGDVRSSGGVEVDQNGGTEIQGKTTCNADPVKLPQIDVTSYDPDIQKMEGVQELPPSMDSQKLEGAGKRKGDLTVNGDLTLDGALIYVNGDLTIHGSVKGKGGLFVTGKTTIDNGAKLDTANSAVLVSKGDVALGGTGKDSSAFQGVIYTEGNFAAKNITLLGAFITNSGSDTAAQVGDTGGSMSMTNVNMVYTQQYTKINIPVAAKITKVTTTTTTSSLVNAQQIAAPWLSQSIYIPTKYGTYSAPMSAFWTGAGFNSAYAQGTYGYFHTSTGGTGWGSWVGLLWVNPMAQYDLSSVIEGAIAQAVQQVANTQAQYQIAYNRALAEAQSKVQEETQQTVEPEVEKKQVGSIDIDLNRFLKLQDKMRIVLWKEWEQSK